MALLSKVKASKVEKRLLWRWCGLRVITIIADCDEFSGGNRRVTDDIIIQGTETVNTSFPNFAELANRVDLSIEVK